MGVENFLYDRAFDDCLDRLGDIQAEFTDVLVAGCPNPQWPGKLAPSKVTIVDPGKAMAGRAGGICADLETLPLKPGSFDLCISIGILDTANQLELAAAALELILKPGGLLLGAVAGGQSLPRLRAAMLAADSVTGQAAPHVHPRIEAASLAHLLNGAGFVQPVVDVDRVDVAYRSLEGLARDLRAMGGTNILTARPRRPLSRKAIAAARQAFLGGEKRVLERIEILHFAAWKAA